MKTSLEQVITKDKLPLAGIVFQPENNKKAAAIWIHGLSSSFFYGMDRTKILAQNFTDNGIALAAFNNRGFGIINKAKLGVGPKAKRMMIGAAYEKFEDCIKDIEAQINFLKARGYKKIFLLGHSTGANKVVYYLSKVSNRNVVGVALLGSVSDIPGIKQELGTKFDDAISLAEKMFKNGKGDELMPRDVVGDMLFSASRFVSIAKEGMPEDTFPAYDPSRKMYWADKVKIPIAVVMGEKDEYASRPVKELLGLFERDIPQKYLTTKTVIGADHGFAGKEKQLASYLVNFMLGCLHSARK